MSINQSDSVSLYAEGTFEEQIQELVSYLARGLTDEPRLAFFKPFRAALGKSIPLGDETKEEDPVEGKDEVVEFDDEKKRKILVLVLSQVKGLGEGNDREIEGFFNLLFSHLFSLFPDYAQSKEHVTALVKAITSTPPSEHATIKYRILSNLFNTLPRQSPLRFDVVSTLLDLAAANDDLEVLQIGKSGRSNVSQWLEEWDIDQAKKGAFLKSVADAYEKTGDSEQSYTYLLSYLRSIPASSPSISSAALQTIAAALRIPTIFSFDQLLKIPAVQAVKAHALFKLLHIFLVGDLKDFTVWKAANEPVLKEFGLEADQLERKIRFLTLATLSAKHIGHDLPYSEIASALRIDIKQVEGWVIDVIRANLLAGKLSQPTQTFHVTRSTSRTLGKEEWEALEQRLVGWKTGLLGVLEVVKNARRSAGGAGGLSASAHNAEEDKTVGVAA